MGDVMSRDVPKDETKVKSLIKSLSGSNQKLLFEL